MIASIQKNWRFLLVVLFLVALFSVLVVRMLTLQVFDVNDKGVSFLQGQGDARTVRKETIPAHRGMITDRNGQPLAVSTPVVSIWVNPQHLSVDEEKLAKLARHLDLSSFKLKEKLSRYKTRQFVYLKRHLSPLQAEEILSLRIKGVYGQEEYRRYYPAGEVAAHLVGFTSIDDKGLEGVEYTYDEWLQGHAGSKEVVKDLFQRTIKELKQIKDPEPGKDIALSIDLRLQYLAYRSLKSAVKKHRADAGSAVVLDVETGEVLAIVNQPAFNPNDRSEMSISSVRNRAVTDMFEPGSTVKPLTIVAALESGKYKPHTKINTSPGYIKVGKKTLLDPVNYGVIDVTKVITKSSQVGTTKIALSLEQDALREAFYKMGLGQYVGTGFPGESTGHLPNRTKWRPIERATFAFGHGLSVTALQLARAYGVLANKGVKLPVSLTRVDEPVEGEGIITEKVASDVVDMLKTVVGSKGTAKKAVTDAYSVAGKTGTSHKVGKDGYESSKYMSIFAGMAPADSPRIVTVVVVDDPKGKEYYGGEVAAPVFSEIVSGSLRMLNVAPDKLMLPSASLAVNLSKDSVAKVMAASSFPFTSNLMVEGY